MSPSYRAPVLSDQALWWGTTDSYADLFQALQLGAPAAAAWPTANLAIYVPIYLPFPTSFSQIAWLNGTVTASTQMEAALYNESGTTKLATSGVITQAGSTGVPETAALATPLRLGRGRYWLGLVFANNTTQIYRYTSGGVFDPQKWTGQSEQTLGSTALPTSITFGTATNNYIPVAWLYQTALAL